MEQTKHSATAETVRHWARTLLETKGSNPGRYMVGLVGAPGAGKSTFAAQLVEGINQEHGRSIAVVVPMDGFHYSNEELDRRQLRPLKGIPATFDAQGFVNLVRLLKEKQDESVFCPRFDRSIEASIENGIEIAPHHQIIVSEGNYLLMDVAPWNQLPELFNEIWYINTDVDTIVPRLLKRHKAGGRNEAETRAKMESTDLPNAALIESTKPRAHRVIDI